MNIPTIKYNIVNAQLGLKIDEPIMQMKQREADLTIKQPPADITIKTVPGRFEIDQSEAFADVDYKGPLRRTKEWVAKAIQEFEQDTARTAQQGDQLMKIENGGGAIPKIAKQNGETPLKEIALGFLPKNHFRVKIDIEPNKVEIDVKKNDPIIESKINPPEINIPRWQVKAYMKQMPSISFDVIGTNVNTEK